MTSPWVMALLLLYYGATFGVVLSAYREDEPGPLLRGAVRRTLVFVASVVAVAAAAYLVSATVLRPGA